MRIEQVAVTLSGSLGIWMDIRVPWRADWAWGIPLILLTVMFHVFGLGFIRDKIIPIHSRIMRRRHPTIAFALVMGSTTLLATVLHGLEAAIWAATYCMIGALSEFKIAMFYSLGAMTTYGHENFHLLAEWQLLGAIEALNGWLLFGLSTAFLFGMIEKVTPENHR